MMILIDDSYLIKKENEKIGLSLDKIIDIQRAIVIENNLRCL